MFAWVPAAPRTTPRLAGVAQLVEQLIRNQQVVSSSLTAGSNFPNKTPRFQPSRMLGVCRGQHLGSTRAPFDTASVEGRKSDGRAQGQALQTAALLEAVVASIADDDVIKHLHTEERAGGDESPRQL